MAGDGGKDHAMDDDLDQAKGKIKQAAGDLTDNDRLKREGVADEKAGKLKGTIENMKDKVDDAIDHLKDRFHRKD
jgi:uncharacterized protein YjbJ (UPF0337 family)